jgi:hypothetical protein
MARLPLLCLFLLLSGCAPQDPLDHKAKASTPSDFSDWWEDVKVELSDDQRTEAYQLIRYLRDATPRLKSMKADDPYDPFCKRINRLRLRDIMILAYEDKNDWLRKKVIGNSSDLPALVEASSKTDDPDGLRYIQSRIDYARTFIDQYNEQIAANDRRIAELQPVPKP